MSARSAVLERSTGADAWRPRAVVTHQGAVRRFPSLTERFWANVTADESDCWIWAGERTGDGYGLFSINPVRVAAYRWSYTLLRAPIPDGLDLDHLCFRPACVNPWHLEPVPRALNVSRARRRAGQVVP
jgi:hypothetical protein